MGATMSDLIALKKMHDSGAGSKLPQGILWQPAQQWHSLKQCPSGMMQPYRISRQQWTQHLLQSPVQQHVIAYAKHAAVVLLLQLIASCPQRHPTSQVLNEGVVIIRKAFSNNLQLMQLYLYTLLIFSLQSGVE